MVGLKQPRRQRFLTPSPTSDTHRTWFRERGTLQPHRRTNFQCREETKATCREEVSPAGTLLVKEEGFARVIFQQIFIETNIYLPGFGIDTAPVLMGLGPGRDLE